MTTILRDGIEKIIRIFYQSHNEKTHLREIARKTKLYGQSVTRHLNKLEKGGILISEREGNLKKYCLGKSNKSYSILSLFDVERFEKLPQTRKQAINSYLNKLSEKPIFAILFGSTAKGSYREDSDIDILLVTNWRIDAKSAEKEADSLFGVKISTFQIRYDRFLKEIKLKEDSVIQSAFETGYPLLNHIAYYWDFYERT